jgi:predicted MPP superfamily phosphohydrolase
LGLQLTVIILLYGDFLYINQYVASIFELRNFSYKLPVSVVDDNHEVANDEISDKEIMIAERDALFQY